MHVDNKSSTHVAVSGRRHQLVHSRTLVVLIPARNMTPQSGTHDPTTKVAPLIIRPRSLGVVHDRGLNAVKAMQCSYA